MADDYEAAIQAGAGMLTGWVSEEFAQILAKDVIDAALAAGHLIPMPPRSYARKGWELYHEARAEVERLREAIRLHRDRWAAKGKATNWDHELWSVLDDEEQQ